MPALDSVVICEERAAYLRTLQLTLGDTLAQLTAALTATGPNASNWRAELRGRAWGLSFALEQARS